MAHEPADFLLYRADGFVWCHTHAVVHERRAPDDGDPNPCDEGEWRQVYYRAEKYE